MVQFITRPLQNVLIITQKNMVLVIKEATKLLIKLINQIYTINFL